MSGYPERPGWKGTETSRAAADAVAPAAGRMEDRCEAYLRAYGPASPEEVAAGIARPGERLLLTSVRARICGLRAKGRVVATDKRGLGESGRCKVIKWRVATPEEIAAFNPNDTAPTTRGEY